MISPIRPRIRVRLRRLILTGFARSGLLIGVMCATANATPPASSTPAAPPPAATPAPAPPPDEGLLEFLGSDDVGDAAWWEFLKKAPPPGNNPPATPPPQDAKK
jgi:hypothetical protein